MSKVRRKHSLVNPKKEAIMDLVCPQCNATYQIPDDRVPAKKAILKCKRCEYRIPVKPLAASAETRRNRAPAQPLTKKNDIALRKKAIANEILEPYPQLAAYDACVYQIDRILQPNKKSSYKTRLNKFKVKLLELVKPVVDRLLEENEQVTGIAAGLGYYPLEIFLGNGVLTMLYNRYVLVATDRRLLAVNTNYRLTKPAHYLFQFPYGDIKKASSGLFGTGLILNRKQGKRRIFTGLKRSLAKEMKLWISERIGSDQTASQSEQLQDNLCPACFVPLPAKLATCPQCRASFKTPKSAALRSLLLPGLGDIYLGHRLIGCFELLGGLAIWLLALSMILGGEADGIAVGVILLIFFNGMDALLTLHMAKKGYILVKQQPQRNIADRAMAGAA